jgi:hypothetical protein
MLKSAYRAMCYYLRNLYNKIKREYSDVPSSGKLSLIPCECVHTVREYIITVV